MISLETGGIIASKYRLERPLARGGMGAVWVARHIELDVLVGIKIMIPEYASSARGQTAWSPLDAFGIGCAPPSFDCHQSAAGSE